MRIVTNETMSALKIVSPSKYAPQMLIIIIKHEDFDKCTPSKLINRYIIN
jgi:hypothetical protein